MGQLISQPLTDKTVEHKTLPRFSYALGSMQGYRLTQEDAHAVHFQRDLPFWDVDGGLRLIDVKIFAVFDGHGGSESSRYLSHELIDTILSHLTQKLDESADGDYGLHFSTTQGLVIHKIKAAFLQMDQHLYQHLKYHGAQCGSTAIVCVLIDNEQLYSINTGDSRLVVSYEGSAKSLSYDHKPTHIGELIRINDAGGSVSYNRVGGVLALSRAFGDFTFKSRRLADNQTLHSEETQVTVEPECITHHLSIKDEFIVLACDGIWDVFTARDLVHFIRHCLVLGMVLPAITAKVLEHSISLANQQTGAGFDNMTMIIIACQQHGETLEQWYKRIKSKIELEKFG